MKKVKRGDIWFADLGAGEGSEQMGVRPVLILQNDIGNEYSPTVIVASMTDSKKRFVHTHVAIKAARCMLKKDSTVLLEQIRTIDKRRLITWNSTVPAAVMRDVDEKIKISFGLISFTLKERGVHHATNN